MWKIRSIITTESEKTETYDVYNNKLEFSTETKKCFLKTGLHEIASFEKPCWWQQKSCLRWVADIRNPILPRSISWKRERDRESNPRRRRDQIRLRRRRLPRDPPSLPRFWCQGFGSCSPDICSESIVQKQPDFRFHQIRL